MKALKYLFHCGILAGVIVFVVGLYYMMFKAGIPYQDPTPEMTLHWTAAWYAGEACMKTGAAIFGTAVIGSIAVWLTQRRERKQQG